MGGEFTMTLYRVVRVDDVARIHSVLHETYDRAVAEWQLAEARELMGKQGVRIKLIARDEPGWHLVEE